MAQEAGDGLALHEDRPDIDQPHGYDYRELQHIKKGYRIRLEKEHNCAAAVLSVNNTGGEHLQGSAKIYVDDYSVAWPTTRPDESTALSADDYGRIALDTGSTPNRVAIYTSSGWTELGTLIGGEIVINDLKLSEQSSDPTNTANYGFIYTKEVSGVTELFYIDSGGNAKQITNGGQLNVVAADIPADEINETKIRLQNNSYLTARNAADDGDIDLIKVDGSDNPTLPDGTILAGQPDGSNDDEVATTKYVDDEIVSEAKPKSGSFTEVFDGIAPTTYTDLDLSSVVGSNSALVILSVYSNVSNADDTFISVRKNGSTDVLAKHMVRDGWTEQIIAETDTSGVVEWEVGTADYDFTINVLAYWKL